MAVVPIPTVRRRRAWLDREALRIAAGTRTASVSNVVNAIWRGHVMARIDHDAAEADTEEALAYLTARIEQIKALLSEPAPFPDRGRRHG